MNQTAAKRTYTAQEKRLKLFLDFLVILYGLAIFGYLLPGIMKLPPALDQIPFLSDPAFVNNSVIKISLCFLVCTVAVADIRRFRPLIQLFILANLISVITGCLLYFFMTHNYTVILSGQARTIRSLLPYSILIDGVVLVVLFVLHVKADKSYYRLAYLTPAQYRTLVALAEVVIRSDNKEAVISPEDTAGNVDQYLSNFKAKTKWITKLTLIG